jgi:ketosteroid isomerase-like protein
MSQENVERVRRGLAAYNAGNWMALREFYDPDVVMHHLDGWPEPGPSVGRDAVMREIGQLHDSFEVQTAEITNLVDAGDRVVARYLWRGTGRGPETAMEFTFVFTIRDGKCVHEAHFWDQAAALRAAGLEG